MRGNRPRDVELSLILDTRPSRYALFDGPSREVLVTGEEVSGFFSASTGEPPVVVFRNARVVNNRLSRTDEGVLQIFDESATKIGEYYIGRAVRQRSETTALLESDVAAQVTFDYFGNRCEYAGAEAIWRHWTSNLDAKAGEWLLWPHELHDDWLHVLQNSWFARGHRAGNYGTTEQIVLDGAVMPERASLYCALGEAVNGPRGYFGSNLDALEDCLSHNYAGVRPSRVLWRKFEASEELLGTTFLNSFMQLLSEYAIEVTTHGA